MERRQPRGVNIRGAQPRSQRALRMSATARDVSFAVRTAKSAGWIMVWQMSTRIMGIVSTICLVRLLPTCGFRPGRAGDIVLGGGRMDFWNRCRRLSRPREDA